MPDAARAACVGYVAIVDDSGVMDDGLIHIGVVDDSPIHSNYGCVVGEVATAPLTTGEADAHVAEAIVDAAVVADVLSPIA